VTLATLWKIRSPACSRLQCFVDDKWNAGTEFIIISMRARGGCESHTPGAPRHRRSRSKPVSAARRLISPAGNCTAWGAVDLKCDDVTSMTTRQFRRFREILESNASVPDMPAVPCQNWERQTLVSCQLATGPGFVVPDLACISTCN